VPEALQAFGRALAIAPERASAAYNRGVALRALGQREAAEADFRRALELDPGHGPARRALGR
jgi:tetratricopeptide (TPR) repeat protein